MSAGKRGGGTLETQVRRLEEQLTEADIKEANRLASQKELVVRCAMKKIGLKRKSNGPSDILTKKQQRSYELLRGMNSFENPEEFADLWKAEVIRERKNRKEKKAKMV